MGGSVFRSKACSWPKTNYIEAQRMIKLKSLLVHAACMLGMMAGLNPARLSAAEPVQFSGIYPHLASFNQQNECGTGAVVPWAGRLWWLTYAPHQPKGSDDKLYWTDERLELNIFADSIGGTPANRMIHDESKQLFIGPYVIDHSGKVRTIPYTTMYGRPTANARHLTDPAGKIYAATMEEGLYEVDVHSLKVTELWRDEQLKGGRHSNLPGYHGKGMFSGYGRLVYANNGEHGDEALKRPDVPSGCLASWDTRAENWTVVSRRQFTEVTGPGGIHGNAAPDRDPLWSIGWDHRSLILMTLGPQGWSQYRLPKASHTYDGAHGWNTEWPRIRDIGEPDLLMTMHGTFWRFPRTFAAGQAYGLRPRSTYLKVVGDFCRWNDRIVLGCDDAAKAEFLNTRKAKGKLAGPAQSQSNLWFVEPSQLDRLGPALGHGAVWLDDAVEANLPSDAFLFAGYDHRGLHLVHDAGKPVEFVLEIDARGDGRWTELARLTVPGNGYLFHSFAPDAPGEWIRVRSLSKGKATAWFEYRQRDSRPTSVLTTEPAASGLAETGPAATGLATTGQIVAGAPGFVGGLVRADSREIGLQWVAAASAADGKRIGYRLTPELKWQAIDDASRNEATAKSLALVTDALVLEGDSVLVVDDDGQRYRLPIGNSDYRAHPELFRRQRTSRETTTERDLFQCAGTFYELPARNAGGMAKLRPIATHPYFIQDYCSWRGMLVLAGATGRPKSDGHHVQSDDGKASVWLGAVDDLWRFGKPTGIGGPWTNEGVKPGEWSDPFLMTGFDRKRLELAHDSSDPVTISAQIDLSGNGQWQTYAEFAVPAGKTLTHDFPESFAAYWIRFQSSRSTKATARLVYE